MTFVGREAELRRLIDALAGARSCRGGVVAVTGEAGIGKSRLVDEFLARAVRHDEPVLVGRAADGAGHVPYRPLVEVLLSATRAGVPDAPELRPFLPALGALAPTWRSEAPANDAVDLDPLVVGEGLLRLTVTLAGGRAAVLVLEDLHWADPETVAVVEYLADHAQTTATLVVVTLRTEAPSEARARIRQSAVRRALASVPLAPLGPTDVGRLVEAVTGAKADAEVVAAIIARAEGVPLLVEELAAEAGGSPATVVPDTLTKAVADRVRGLPDAPLALLEAAAVIGRVVDVDLAATAIGMSPGDASSALRVLADRGLLEPVTTGDLRFRHPLLRDATLAQVVAPRRRQLAAAAAAAVETSPELSDERRQLAAELHLTAGHDEAAARHLLAIGRKALVDGALRTAEDALRRARAAATGPSLRRMIETALVETLAAAARTDEALAIGERLTVDLESGDDATADVAALHLLLARAARAATRGGPARRHLAAAGQVAARSDDDVLHRRIAVVDALLAIDEGRATTAMALAERALTADAGGPPPDVAAEAHEVIGRCERPRDLDAARAAFERERAVAERHGLRLHAIRALHELGTIDMFSNGRVDRLERASDLAYAAGALSLAATVDLQLVGVHAFQFRPDDARDAGRRCLDVAAALGLDRIRHMGLLQLAFTEAIAGDTEETARLVDRAVHDAQADDETAALAAGHVRAASALLREDRVTLRAELEAAMTAVRRLPSVPPGIFPGVHALVAALDGRAGGIGEVRALAGTPLVPAVLELADAVVAGRGGHGAQALVHLGRGDEVLRAAGLTGWAILLRRLVAEAAIADGWGDPAHWLHETIDWFTSTPHSAVVDASYALLRRVGVRRRRSDAPVPPALRRLGLTPRETEVLQLVADRLGNREIAERLFISTRTVEKHVESLLAKTGAADRNGLAVFVRAPD